MCIIDTYHIKSTCKPLLNKLGTWAIVTQIILLLLAAHHLICRQISTKLGTCKMRYPGVKSFTRKWNNIVWIIVEKFDIGSDNGLSTVHRQVARTGTKPVFEPIFVYCSLGPLEQISANPNTHILIKEMHLKMLSVKWASMPQCALWERTSYFLWYSSVVNPKRCLFHTHA